MRVVTRSESLSRGTARFDSWPRRFAWRPSMQAGGRGADEVVEWDVATWAKAVSFWRQHAGERLRGARVLEVGTRDGGLTHWLVAEGATVVASDVHGPTPLAVGRHRDYLADGRVTHIEMDATDIPFNREFDAVVFKSVLGSIGGAVGAAGQDAAIRGMFRALKPGGLLLFAENLESSPLHLWLRRRMVAWGSQWRYMQFDEMRDALREFESVEYSTAGFLATLGRSERQRQLLAGADSLVFDWAVPRRWNYVMFGIARKAL